MASEAQTKPSDMILSLRLDALRKNLQQIMGMRESILDGRKEVVELHRLAKDTEAGIEWRLDELDGHVRMALKAISALQDIVPPARLERLRASVEGAQKRSSEISSGFPEMVEIIGRMAERWAQIASERIPAGLGSVAAQRATKVEGLEETLSAQSESASDSSRKGIWDEYEWMAFGQGKGLFGEYVDVIGGLALRNTGVDQGVCQMADDLLQCLHSAWRARSFESMAVPTRRMAAEPSLAQIIRLGFPEWTVWALPLGAHEFGHVVLADSDALVAEATQETGITQSQIATYLADAFGAAVVGPAYACAAILLALDPCIADEKGREAVGADEPERTLQLSPDSRRVHVILEVLDLMDGGHGTVSPVAGQLRDAWSSALDTFGLSLDAAWDQPLQSLAKLMWNDLQARAFQLPYRAGQFATVSQWKSLRAHPAADFPDSADDIRDILNAAWIQRLNDPTATTGENAVELAEAARDLWRERFGGRMRAQPAFAQEVKGP
jgi:hypothetical protein